MNDIDYRDVAVPVGLVLANLFCAGVVHRAILHNAELLRRRPLFESLAAMVFGLAVLLSVVTLLLWERHPSYIVGCAIGWCVACLVAGLALSVRDRRRAGHNRLRLPALDPADRPAYGATGSTERPKDSRLRAVDRIAAPTHLVPLPIDRSALTSSSRGEGRRRRHRARIGNVVERDDTSMVEGSDDRTSRSPGSGSSQSIDRVRSRFTERAAISNLDVFRASTDDPNASQGPRETVVDRPASRSTAAGAESNASSRTRRAKPKQRPLKPVRRLRDACFEP